jgi:hypothetical protein
LTGVVLDGRLVWEGAGHGWGSIGWFVPSVRFTPNKQTKQVNTYEPVEVDMTRQTTVPPEAGISRHE